MSGLRVLVVDDSAIARQVLSGVLALQGMEVRAASDPLIALGKMRTWAPDVIVLDLEMPRMDGLTFLRLLRKQAMATPVVICSGVAGERSAVALRAPQAYQAASKVVHAVMPWLHGAQDLRAASTPKIKQRPVPRAPAGKKKTR